MHYDPAKLYKLAIRSVKKTRKNITTNKSYFFNDVYCAFSPINNTNEA